MASKIVQVVGVDWAELSAKPKGCFQNQTGSVLLYWVSDVKPLDTQKKGHEISHLGSRGFEIDDALGMKLWARTLSTDGDVIVTEY